MITLTLAKDALDAGVVSTRTVPFTTDALPAYLPLEILEHVESGAVDVYRNDLQIPANRVLKARVQDGDTIHLQPRVGVIAALVMMPWALIGHIVYWVAVVGAIGYSIYSALNPKTASYGSGDQETSPNQGWEGVSNTASTGIPIAAIIGNCWVGGNYTNSYVETTSDFKSIFWAEICLGHGPLTSIAGYTFDTDEADVDLIGDLLLVNDTPINQLTTPTVRIRMGSEGQEIIPGFDKQHNMDSYGGTMALDADDPTEFNSAAGIDADEIALYFHSDAQYKTSSTGKLKSTTITVTVEYKLYGADDDTYVTHGTHTVTTRSTTSVNTTYKLAGLTPGRYTVRLTTTSGASGTSVYRDIGLTQLDTIVYESTAHPGIAKIAVGIYADDLVSSSVPTIKSWCIGQKLIDPFTLTETVTNNPASALLTILLDTRWGAGNSITIDDIDIVSFQKAATYYAEQVYIEGSSGDKEDRYQFNGIIDSSYELPDLLTKIANSYQSNVFDYGGKLFLVAEMPGVIEQLVTTGNVSDAGVTLSIKPPGDAYNTIAITYIDDTILDTDVVSSFSAEVCAGTESPRSNSLNLFGVRRRSEAARMAERIRIWGQEAIRSVSYKPLLSHQAVKPGTLVGIAADVPMWGLVSGVLTAADASTVSLNRDVTFNLANTYYIRVQHRDDDSIETLQLAPAVTQYTKGTPIPLAEVWDTEPPAAWSSYAVGESSDIDRTYRIVKVMENSDGELEIEGIEYITSLFTDDGVANLGGSEYAVTTRLYPPSVENLCASNVTTSNPTAVLSWTVPQSVENWGVWGSAQIWMSLDGNYYEKVGESASSGFEVSGLTSSEAYWFKVISVSVRPWLATEPAATAPVVQIGIVVEDAPPNVEGLELKGLGSITTFVGKNPVFTWHRTTLTTQSATAGDEVSGTVGQETADSFASQYLVVIEVDDVIVHEAWTDLTEYTYTYEQNYEDNGGTPARAFTVKVWASDSYGRLSEYPAVLSVNNPVPAALTSVTASSAVTSIVVTWDLSTEVDTAGYIVHRGTSQGFTPTDDTEIFRGLTSLCVDAAPTVGSTYYYKVAAFDDFGATGLNYTESGAVTSTGVQATDIESFVVDASRIWINLPLLEGDVWLSNSPDTGMIAWNAHTVYLNGTGYAVAAGNTSNAYVYWNVGDTAYTTTNTHPADLGSPQTRFFIAWNNSGAVRVVWNNFANIVVGSANIENLAVLDAHISSLTGDKIVAASITGDKIAANTITAANIEVGSQQTSISGITFSYDDNSVLYWTAGQISYVDSSGDVVAASVSSGSADWRTVAESTTGTMCVFWKLGEAVLSVTDDAADALLSDQVLICSYKGGTLLYMSSYGKTVVDGGDIVTESITADKLSVASLSAIAAALGTITSGSITLTMDAPNDANQIKIDNTGIHVSHDSGVNWVNFLALVDGKLVISFDSLDPDAEATGLRTLGPVDWETAWEGSVGYSYIASGSWSPWKYEAIASLEHYDQLWRVHLDVTDNNGNMSISNKTVEVALTTATGTLLNTWSFSVDLTEGVAVTVVDGLEIKPFQFEVAVGESARIGYRIYNSSSSSGSVTFGSWARNSVIGYANTVYKEG